MTIGASSFALFDLSVDKGVARLDNMPPSGGVPEWPKGSDCKSDAKASVVRIHPPPPGFCTEINAK